MLALGFHMPISSSLKGGTCPVLEEEKPCLLESSYSWKPGALSWSEPLSVPYLRKIPKVIGWGLSGVKEDRKKGLAQDSLFLHTRLEWSHGPPVGEESSLQGLAGWAGVERSREGPQS